MSNSSPSATNGQPDVEEWRELHTIHGMEFFLGYRVSSLGKVETRNRKTKAKGVIGPWYPLKQRVAGKNYTHLSVLLWNGSRHHTVYVHRLVLLAFGPPPPFRGAWALHLDDNPSNNVITNLHWGDQSINAHDAIRNGRLHRIWENTKGERNPRAILDNNDVRQILLLHQAGKTQTSIARHFGVARRTVRNILNGQKWTHIPRPGPEGGTPGASYNPGAPSPQDPAQPTVQNT